MFGKMPEEHIGGGFGENVGPNQDVFLGSLSADLYQNLIVKATTAAIIKYDKMFNPAAVKPRVEGRKLLQSEFADWQAHMPQGTYNVAGLKKFAAGTIAFVCDPINLVSFGLAGKIIGKASAPLTSAIMEKNFAVRAMAASAKGGAIFGTGTVVPGAVNMALSKSTFHDDYNSLSLLHDVGQNAIMGLELSLVGHIVGEGIGKALRRSRRSVVKSKFKDIVSKLPDESPIRPIPELLKADENKPIVVESMPVESMKQSMELAEGQSAAGNKVNTSLALKHGFNEARNALKDQPIEKLTALGEYTDAVGKDLKREISVQKKLIDSVWEELPEDEKVLNPYDIAKMLHESGDLPRSEQTLTELFFNHQLKNNIIPNYIKLATKVLKEPESHTENAEIFLNKLKNFDEITHLDNGLKTAIIKENDLLAKNLRNRKQLINKSIDEGSLNPHKEKSPVASSVYDTENIVRHSSTFELMELHDELSKMREAKNILDEEALKTQAAKDLILTHPSPLTNIDLIKEGQNNLNSINDDILQNPTRGLQNEIDALPEADNLRTSTQLQERYDKLTLTKSEQAEFDKLSAERNLLPKWKQAYKKLVDCLVS